MGNRVLVIDDSNTIRKLVELSFRTLPFNVDYAISGMEGVTKAQSAKPDVVLLDVVLPDMKGMEVCQRLARDSRTNDSLVILMSAKDESIREQFKSFPQVMGFLHKPFSAKDLATHLEKAQDLLAQRATQGNAPRVADRFTFDQKEAVAKALYSKLKVPFSLIPEWMGQLGNAQPANFFARRILSPELIEELLGAVLPFIESKLERATPSPEDAKNRDPLTGQLARFPLLHILRAVAASQRLGVLELTSGSRRTWLYFRNGLLVLVTNDTPADYVREVEVDLSMLAAEARRRAEAEQVRTGKPLFVSLAESGLLPSAELSSLLYVQGKRALLEVLDAEDLRFAWRDLPALPLFVEAQGRELTFGQLQLEQLRRESASLATERGADAFSWVYERLPGFSRRLRQFDLTPDERRVLTLIDGKHPVSWVLRRCGLSPSLVSSVVHRLADVELIRRVEVRPTTARHAVVIDPDVEGVARPLEQLLSKRREPLTMKALRHDEPQLAAAILKERPHLLVVNATVVQNAPRLASELMDSHQASGMMLVALLEARDREQSEALISVGFDAVLNKPIWFGDLEQLLNG